MNIVRVIILVYLIGVIIYNLAWIILEYLYNKKDPNAVKIVEEDMSFLPPISRKEYFLVSFQWPMILFNKFMKRM